ncbi:hypothetical protein GUITHDRAFT_105625 [Guillardia theta CCMP2712]|uniref:Uncharacterized protein n=1 Tax=Guillardia theta (strain CCMP2712) TaxID=905079 RepID=L1JIX9_GUITC|nr:hypothetical protein GUITHDRAFT_105625 [Guillardia theta CCMP2712]EKX48478.1 hypothetical protein GUITHDRAFT_105625 [Guillardia theta CCMP2712]|eukprot:XP_005835458.1 hypothetical protein GUITHDRAFT_105625 [Guillardia theta CCMP2712]
MLLPDLRGAEEFERHLKGIERETRIRVRDGAVGSGKMAGEAEAGERWFVFALNKNFTDLQRLFRVATVMCEDADVCKGSLDERRFRVHPRSFVTGGNGTLKELEIDLQDLFMTGPRRFFIDSASDLDTMFLLKLIRKNGPGDLLVLLRRCNAMLESISDNMGMKKVFGRQLEQLLRGWGFNFDHQQSCVLSNEFAGARGRQEALPFRLPPAHTQQSLEQIRVTWNELQRGGAGHKKLLIFGLGHDSDWWASVNPGGETVFVEDNKDWIKHVLQSAPNLDVVQVTYSTVLGRDLNKFRDRDKWGELAMNLPPRILQHKWDVVLVDAPMGFAPENPGRMQSIYMATKLVRKGGLVVVDDCERPAEELYMRLMLGEGNMFHTVGRRGKVMKDGTLIAGNKQCYFRM